MRSSLGCPSKWPLQIGLCASVNTSEQNHHWETKEFRLAAAGAGGGGGGASGNIDDNNDEPAKFGAILHWVLDERAQKSPLMPI